MVQSSSISITPSKHADRHIHGAEDPLIGDVRIDAMAPANHHVSHETGGSDVINIANHTDTSVFHATLVATTWTDLDISAVVGSRVCLVLLEVLNRDAGSGTTVGFRAKGDTGTQYISTRWGVNCCNVNPGSSDNKTVIVNTDSAGVIQYYSSHAHATTISVRWWI